MSQHDLAFTLLTSQSDERKIVLATQRRYTDDSGTAWVETAEGRVRESDLRKATRDLDEGLVNRYGESLTGDTELDKEIRKTVEAHRRKKLDDNKAAIANLARIELPVEDARNFKVGVWYDLEFRERDAGQDLRSLIGNVVHQEDAVAVERQQERERPAERS